MRTPSGQHADPRRKGHLHRPGHHGRLTPRDRAGFGNIISAVGKEDAAELKKLTEAQLAKSCVPTVSYTVDAVALARAGEGFEGADEATW